ncbi:hypothetical protein B6U99_03440 [Candidatus Geothermarchaeota archaeon ex4572_27]|nr:MAG: hypothetical protein B6U99_03440 [Candidatus Geothermarchaeota archaeon ex4572_27]
MAGGAGRRFRMAGGRGDKALFEVEGKPMVARVVEAASQVASEVVVVVDTPMKAERYRAALGGARVVVDDEGPRGPLTGIRTGLKALSSSECLVVPCDVPFMKVGVLERLIDRLRRGVSGVVPLWPGGAHEPLIAAYRRDEALEISLLLGRLGRARPDDLLRAGLEVEFMPISEIRDVDPSLESFINVNRPGDLSRRPPRLVGEARAVRLRPPTPPLATAKLVEEAMARGWPSLADEAGVPFWSAMLRRGLSTKPLDLIEASRWHEAEADEYGRLGLKLLRARALIDAHRCLEEVGVHEERLFEEALRTYREVGIERKG